MKRIRIWCLLTVLLLFCGCSFKPDIPLSVRQTETSAPVTTTAVDEHETDSSFSSQPVTGESAETADAEVSEIRETAQEAQQAETSTAYVNEEKPSESSSQPVSRNDNRTPEESQTDPTEEKKPDPAPEETSEPVTEAPPEPEPTQEPDPEPEPVEEPVTEPEPEPEPAFDIDYWIGFARNLAESKGLVLDSTAVECWDNPITANPGCIYLERDLTSRISRYAGDEDITAVWIWYESAGTNEYLIYIGYA